MMYTYAILDISRAAFDEIAAKLRAAGYDHAFDRDVIDMHGIAVRVDENAKENGTQPPCGDDAARPHAVMLARQVVDLLGRCQLYGPADALRDTAARLLTCLADQGPPP